MLAEEGEYLAPAIHCLLRPVECPVQIEDAVAGPVVAVDGLYLPYFFSSASCWFTCSGLGARSSLPKMPSRGHERSFVMSIGATGFFALSSVGAITTPPPHCSTTASMSFFWQA